MAIENQYDSQHFLVKSINILLETIGELPISTLDDVANILEAQVAESVIIESKMTVLGYGWDVNTDTNYEFIPDLTGAIVVPPHALDIRSGENIVLRDWKLYDKSRHSRVFDAPVSCTVIWNLDFDTLPHPLRYYITTKAARIFQARVISDNSIYGFTQEDEQNALIAAKKSDGFTGQYNMLTGDYANNFSVAN